MRVPLTIVSLVATAIAIASAGCHGFTPKESSSPDQVKKDMEPSTDHATVVLYIQYGGPRTTIITMDENRQCLAFPDTGEWWIIPMAPGRHELHSLGPKNAGKSVAIEVAAGKTYVLQGKDAEDGIAVLTAIKPGPGWEYLDRVVRAELKAFHPQKEKCAEWISKYFYDHDQFDKLMTVLHQTVQSAPPILGPDDGLVYKGSFGASLAAAPAASAPSTPATPAPPATPPTPAQ